MSHTTLRAPMAITRETVLHVARLARLDLADDEVELMQRDMSNILQYVATLSELDTSEVPETSQVAEEGAPMRADQVRPGVPTEQALAQAPRIAEGSFAVPAFVDE
ncbi:MAG TPA: Asp-tRNA(Asn)/Glu-tRNA(Gln) amidotransferase subunit GatC [Polyangiaceae bacterium]|nr:Asp-tRNA(Asn)/Glu-tRNA(Gln) amidotransferase subunit GatC [Polyangiaceae bacterium]